MKKKKFSLWLINWKKVSMNNQYSPIIGLEVHIELSTDRKMFCDCPAEHFKVKPNTNVCPVCMGLPGALPVPNKQAIEDTLKIASALGCELSHESKFDRKHYFYPDLPKGYQISQYDKPLASGGSYELFDKSRVRIRRVHLEEDTGKLVHKIVDGKDSSLVDYNRSGVPLVEIVTEPDFDCAEDVKEFLKMLRRTVRYLGVSDADMEKGSMRLEANISVSKGGVLPEYKVEIKNVNSFRYLASAIEHEIERQKRVLSEGGKIGQETRGWSVKEGETVVQRVKEEAKDYRYFPEPDIPPLSFSDEDIKLIIKDQPVLPVEIRNGLIKLGVRKEYVQAVLDDQKMAKYALELAKQAVDTQLKPDKAVGMIVNKRADWTKEKPGALLDGILDKKSESKASRSQTKEWAQQAIDSNQEAVEDYREGKETALKFLLGQVMASSQGKADPQVTREVLKDILD